MNFLAVQDGGIAAAVIGREPTNERLAKESLAVINGFGDALFEAVCRDAFDGLNVSRVSSFISNQPVLVFL